MICTGCHMDNLFDDGHYCEACYSRSYTTIERLKKEIQDLDKKAAKISIELMNAREEIAKLKQVGLFDA